MTFLAPAWLWATAAVAVPTIIHLLGRGRGRVVAIGTVRFLPPADSRRLRRLRPTGLWRFLLRVVLLISLALALAGPRWWRSETPRPGERWVLVDPALIEHRDRLEGHGRELYDRLDGTPTGERRWLSAGLPPWSERPEKEQLEDPWSLVAEASRLAPPAASFEVFALDRADTLLGRRPALDRAVAWWSIPDPEPNRWIQRVISTGDELRITIGTSDSRSTRFETLAIDADSTAAETEVRVETTSDRPELALLAGGSLGTDDRVARPDASPPLRSVVRADDDRSRDAYAVRLAIRAVAKHLGRELLTTPTASLADPLDLLVTLGIDLDPETGAAAVRLTDDGAGSTPCRQQVYVEALPERWLRLHRCARAEAPEAVWRNAWGGALLSTEDGTATAGYRWHGRFDPGWSDVDDTALPHLLLGLVTPGDASTGGVTTARSDRRAAPDGTATPRAVTDPAPPLRPDPFPERLAWGLVTVCFVTDRLLGRRGAG